MKLVTLNISSPTELVSIVDLRADYDVINSVNKQKLSVISKTSESQTDNPDGVDFDWDLSDKTDNETQVYIYVITVVFLQFLHPKIISIGSRNDLRKSLVL